MVTTILAEHQKSAKKSILSKQIQIYKLKLLLSADISSRYGAQFLQLGEKRVGFSAFSPPFQTLSKAIGIFLFSLFVLNQ